jgi:hypothetical protein
MFAAINMAGKTNTFLFYRNHRSAVGRTTFSGYPCTILARKDAGDLADPVLNASAKRKYLETTRVSHQGTAPIHKTVESPVVRYHPLTGPEIKMVGICKQHLRASCSHCLRRQRFHARLGTDGYEGRRFNDTVVGAQ